MHCTQIVSIASLVQFRQSSRYARNIAFRAWLKDKAKDETYKAISVFDDAQGIMFIRMYRPNFKR